jgi:hypothetical protein
LQKTVTVKTNDPEQKTIKLKISTDVQVLLALKPSRINFGRLKKGIKSPTKYASLTGTDKDKIKITSVKSMKNYINVETNLSGFENDKKKQIKITMLPDIKLGRLRDRITINTDHEKVKKLTLYVYGEVLGNIMVKPEHLAFGMLKKGKELEKTISLKATSDSSFKVLDVKSTIPELVTKVETIREGKEYKVKVLVKENINKDILKGKVIIKTDDKDQERIEVRVSGRAKKKFKKKPQKKSQKESQKTVK